MAKTIDKKKAPEVLLLEQELIARQKISKVKMNAYMAAGLPYYSFGGQHRFLESEVVEWLGPYRQEQLEREFRDESGRTLAEYVTEDAAVATLRFSKVELIALMNKGLPYAKVGTKNFFHIQDILNQFRVGGAPGKLGAESVGDSVPGQVMEEQKAGKAEPNKANPAPTKQQAVSVDSQPKAKEKRKGSVKAADPEAEPSFKDLLMPFCNDVPKEVPILIVDGSCNLEGGKVGTGIVLIENWNTATGKSGFRNLQTKKTIVAEFLAVVAAFRLIKSKKFDRAVIVTDQKQLSEDKAIDPKKYEKDDKAIIADYNNLLEELKGKVTIEFIRNMNRGKKNPLYKKAHLFSRKYKKETVHNLEFQ